MVESGTMYEPTDISDAFVQINLDTPTTIHRSPASSSSSISETAALQEATRRQVIDVLSDSTVAVRQANQVLSDSTVAVHSVTHDPFEPGFVSTGLRMRSSPEPAPTNRRVLQVVDGDPSITTSRQRGPDLIFRTTETMASPHAEVFDPTNSWLNDEVRTMRYNQQGHVDMHGSDSDTEQSSSAPIDASWRADIGTTSTASSRHADDFDWELWNDLVQHEEAIFSEDWVSEVEQPE